MNFEVLENFEWYNEPENVRFDGNAMIVYAKYGTDFCQSIHRGYKKDNGHFFYGRKKGDLSLTLNWNVENLPQFAQCGIMIRIDERNWFKASIERETSSSFVISSSLSLQGHSDWSMSKIDKFDGNIWFKLVKVGDEYEVFYSIDGVSFIKFRTFYLSSFEDVKIGACISSLEHEDFSAELLDIFIDNPY